MWGRPVDPLRKLDPAFREKALRAGLYRTKALVRTRLAFEEGTNRIIVKQQKVKYVQYRMTQPDSTKFDIEYARNESRAYTQKCLDVYITGLDSNSEKVRQDSADRLMSYAHGKPGSQPAPVDDSQQTLLVVGDYPDVSATS